MKTRIKCQHGGTHTITFHDDGTVTSTGCGDVTAEAKRLSAMVMLGGSASASAPTCAGLAALVNHGVRLIFSKTGVKNGDELPLGGWRDMYQRFESLKVVEATIKRERRAARKRRKAAA